MIDVGDSAPPLSLHGTDGLNIEAHTLATHLADGPVLLAFFPFAFSPTCTEEICNLRDAEWFSFIDGLSVLGISTDGPYALRAFAQKHDLDFPLLSDGDGTAAAAYGVLADEIAGVRNVAYRSTVLVDATGTVRHTTFNENPAKTPDLAVIRDAAMDLAEG